jgi:hypothetical protein
MSKDMHVSQSTKRAETQAKAKATREKNAEKKAEKQRAALHGTKRPRMDDAEGEGEGDVMDIS